MSNIIMTRVVTLQTPTFPVVTLVLTRRWPLEVCIFFSLQLNKRTKPEFIYIKITKPNTWAHLHKMSQLMRLWHFSSPVNSFFKLRMRSHPVGLDVWFLVEPFVYFHSSCVRTAKALARLRRCARSSEPSLVALVIITIISWAGSNILEIWQCYHYCAHMAKWLKNEDKALDLHYDNSLKDNGLNMKRPSHYSFICNGVISISCTCSCS